MIIGLTGGIGSGKTTIAKLFETMGCFIYNSDNKAKELYHDKLIKQQVIALLGAESYSDNNSLNTGYISRKIFSDTILLNKLNSIIHPAIKSDFKLFKDSLPENAIIVKESALLFETGTYKEIGFCVLIIAPHNLKINRVLLRSNLSKIEVEKRIAAQWADDQKKELANDTIINDDIIPVIPQVIRILNSLKKV